MLEQETGLSDQQLLWSLIEHAKVSIWIRHSIDALFTPKIAKPTTHAHTHVSGSGTQRHHSCWSDLATSIYRNKLRQGLSRPPISNYRVGAVALGVSGRVHMGVNLGATPLCSRPARTTCTIRRQNVAPLGPQHPHHYILLSVSRRVSGPAAGVHGARRAVFGGQRARGGRGPASLPGRLRRSLRPLSPGAHDTGPSAPCS